MKRFFTGSMVGFVILPFVLLSGYTLLQLAAPFKLGLPSPVALIADIGRSLVEPAIKGQLGLTLIRVLLSLLISTLLGVIVGILLGYSRRSREVSQPTIDFLRSIPVTFLIPAATLLFGVSDPMTFYVLTTYPALLIMVYTIRIGLAHLNAVRLQTFYLLSGKRRVIHGFISVVLRELLPTIVAGVGVCLSYTIVIATVLEYMGIGPQNGIGSAVYEQVKNYAYERMYSLIIIVGLTGFVLNKLVELAHLRLLHWTKSEH